MKKASVVNKINRTFKTISSMFNNYITMDSREEFNKKILSSITSKEIQNQIDTFNNIRQIKHSFFHNTYIKEILTYTEQPLEFYNCIFDITITDTTDLIFFKYNSFKKCTVYYSTPIFDNEYLSDLENLLSNNNCNDIKIVSNPYLYFLIKRKNINNENFNMLNIDNCDLSNLTMPTNKDFFKKLDKNVIENVKFPKLNLENYDITNIYFINCEFESSSTVPHNFLNTNFKKCILPIINFKHDFNYKINSCVIHQESSFPKDKDFFIKSSFKECTMPKKDYSSYKIDKFSFEKCYFDKDAVLPKDILNPENIDLVFTLSNIPNKTIRDMAKYTYIKEKDTFLNKYNHILSIEERFILKNCNF